MKRPGQNPEEAAIPEPLPVRFETIPERLRVYDQFVVWNYARVDGELKKPPFNPKTGKPASIRTPATWGSFQEAQAAYGTGKYAGIGLVLTLDMGIVAIDIDHCIVAGKLSKGAQQIMSALDSYSERSPSGSGIRIMLAGKLPAGLRRHGTIEMYDDMRYVTLTGQHIATTPAAVQPRHQQLHRVYHRVFGHAAQSQVKEKTGGGVKEGTVRTYRAARSDQEVLEKACSARNGDTFRRYYYGDASLWEGTGVRHSSQSEADFTLVLLLLYWTNNDTNQTDRLFRQSGLMREKWQRRISGSQTYGQRVIADALRKGRR
jgi:putative DNA primase/helicase